MTHKRNVYLKMKTLSEAQEILLRQFPCIDSLKSEYIPVPDSVGRILAESVTSKISSPNFHAAAMDGIAVKAETTFGISETKPKQLTVNKETFYVNTGHVMPEGTDAVIMIEHARVLDENHVEIEAPVFPWQNVRKMGEDIVATELLFPQNHVITPYCIGALLSGGVFNVVVKEKPRVLIIPTGSELVDWRNMNLEDLQPGQVLETNSYVMGSLVEGNGGTYVRHNAVMDDLDKIKSAVTKAVSENYHIVLILGGSSAGSEDYAKQVISDLGEVLVHGVTIMPGKPALMGKIQDKPVFGIPGYPVSAIIAFEQFVSLLMQKMLKQPYISRPCAEVEPTRKIASKLGVEEFLRVKLGKVAHRIVATPLPRGAGCITTITKADGIIRIPNHIEGLKENEPVQAELLRPLSSVSKTIVVVGSHDNTLDVLADEMKANYSDITLSSSHVGSMGGLRALKRGVAHLAGSHLLNTDDGSYNLSYIQKLLPGLQIHLVNLVARDQGLIVAPGNPKGLKGIDDLSRDDISFINRQGGSGTRILLDYRLDQLGIDPSMINGYGNEEFTHMSVAVAVLSGIADAGLGIYAAAKALNMDFIPVVTEEYDLIIPDEHFQTDNIQKLIEIINSKEFKNRVTALGGYSTEKTGTIHHL